MRNVFAYPAYRSIICDINKLEIDYQCPVFSDWIVNERYIFVFQKASFDSSMQLSLLRNASAFLWYL